MSPAAPKREPVDFDAAKLAVDLAMLEGRHNALDSQVAQSIQNLTGSFQAMQADVQRIGERSVDNNTLLHALTERSTAIERIAHAVEDAGKGHAGDTTKVSLEMAHMRGFIRGVVLCGALGFGSLAAFVVYRLDRTDEAVDRLRQVIQLYHPTSPAP